NQAAVLSRKPDGAERLDLPVSERIVREQIKRELEPICVPTLRGSEIQHLYRARPDPRRVTYPHLDEPVTDGRLELVEQRCGTRRGRRHTAADQLHRTTLTEQLPPLIRTIPARDRIALAPSAGQAPPSREGRQGKPGERIIFGVAVQHNAA